MSSICLSILFLLLCKADFMECFHGLLCCLTSIWVCQWADPAEEWSEEGRVMLGCLLATTHHHPQTSPSLNPSQKSLYVTFLLQVLVPALSSHPFGPGAGTSSMLLSQGTILSPWLPYPIPTPLRTGPLLHPPWIPLP